MGKPYKYKSPKSKNKPVTVSVSKETKEEKKQRTYAFGCVAMLLYSMPGMACAALGMAMGASLPFMIVGCVLMFMGAGLGFLGLTLMAKQKGKRLMRILCTVLACLMVIPLPFVGGWYMVFMPVFALLILCIANADVLDNQTDKM